jgi:hypothetical protein
MDLLRLQSYGFTSRDLPRYSKVEEPVLAYAAQLWRAVGVKPVITSSYRTPEENASVGGSANSQHLQGRALDLVFGGVDSASVIAAAERLGVPGLALQYPSGAIHIDARTGARARWGEVVKSTGSGVVKEFSHTLAEVLGMFAPPRAGGVIPIPIIPTTVAGKVSAVVIVAVVLAFLTILVLRH